MQTYFPSFSISPTSAFPSTYSCCCCCCRGVHTATPCDLKSPFRYARQVCPRLLSHRGASAAAVLLSFRRDTTLPACSYAFTIGKFRRWWHSSPPCSTFGAWRLIPAGLPLCARCWSSSQPAYRYQALSPISSPMKLHRSLLFSSRVFISPVQSALLPGSPHMDDFHVLIIGLPQGREQGRVTK